MVAQFRRVILSQNEVAATLSKAARAEGMPLGHADIFVAAAVRALCRNPDCGDEITIALQGPHGSPNFQNARVAMAGPVALDALLCGEAEITLEGVDAPNVLVEMRNNYFLNNSLCAEIDVEGGLIILKITATTPPITPAKGPLTVSPHHWAIWQKLAAKTFVPENDASRLSGAGAGLTDND